MGKASSEVGMQLAGSIAVLLREHLAREYGCLLGLLVLGLLGLLGMLGPFQVLLIYYIIGRQRQGNILAHVRAASNLC